MSGRQLRHTTNAISEPHLTETEAENYFDHSLLGREEKPLCKISFVIENQQEQFIKVYPQTTIEQIASEICDIFGCEYEQCIEEEIKNQLEYVLSESCSSNDEEWENCMKKILGKSLKKETEKSQKKSCYETNNFSFLDNANFTNLMDKKKRWYFEQNNSQANGKQKNKTMSKFFGSQCSNIYERSKTNKELKEQKLWKLQQERENKEMKNCTFHPKTNSKKKNQYLSCEDTFQRLYNNATEIRNKRNQRIKTLCFEEDEKLSELSFIPEINECSRQICRMRSYASLLSQTDEKSFESQGKVKNKKIQKQNQNRFELNPPKSSKKGKGETKKNDQKLLIKRNNSKNSLKTCKSVITFEKQPLEDIRNNYKVKKQRFVIDDDTKQTQKKSRLCKVKRIGDRSMNKNESKEKITLNLSDYLEKEESGLKEDSSFIQMNTNKKKSNTRSQELYNNRKKLILSTIFDYLTISPPVSTEFFKKKNFKKSLQIFPQNILIHPFLPKPIKEMFQPMTHEMNQLNVSLEKEEFLWAVEKLYEDLNVGDKGLLLGWGVKLIPEHSK